MVIEGKRPPAYWPSSEGGISVEDLVISYAPSLPPVIKGVSFHISKREKVGLVGRTGSGKSTMALSLLRFTDPTSGRIMIDGIDITTIGLQDLRSRLTLIAQESVLFSGTIRSNLDPFNEHSDQDCMDALARVRMISAPVPPPSNRGSREPSRASSPQPGQTSALSAIVEAHGHLAPATTDSSSIASGSSTTKVENNGRIGVTLETLVSAGGHNFSAGQRQLLAMARALLKRSSIIIMDEATASVDMITDSKASCCLSCRDLIADSDPTDSTHDSRRVRRLAGHHHCPSTFDCGGLRQSARARPRHAARVRLAQESLAAGRRSVPGHVRAGCRLGGAQVESWAIEVTY